MKCEVAAGGRWNLKDRASGVLVADKKSKGKSSWVITKDLGKYFDLLIGEGYTEIKLETK
jgi:hypothetical protein